MTNELPKKIIENPSNSYTHILYYYLMNLYHSDECNFQPEEDNNCFNNNWICDLLF